MGNFKESEYYMSEKHLININNSRIKGLEKIQRLKEKRIEEYYKNPKLCEECKTPILYEEKNEKKFCNSSCAAKFNNKKRIVSEEQKLKTSITMLNGKDRKEKTPIEKISNEKIRICLNCEKEFLVKRNHLNHLSTQKYCCKDCSKIGMKLNVSKSQLEKVKNGTHKGWTTRNIISYPEKFFIDVLNNNNLNYKHNFIVNKKDLGLNDISSYFLDFYFEDKKIDLEIDGKQHKYRKEHDEKRDYLLEENGIKVYRIEWKNPINEINKEYMMNEINKFLKYVI